MSAALDHRKMYRLPWSLTDNVISWLEPTKECNIYCEGCYSANAAKSHKSLAQVRDDLDVFTRYRQTDAISIAGGEPLVYPQIVEVVRMIAERGLKPVINSNGKALTSELLRELKRAGLHGFTFHIDSLQRREGWTGKSEIELNELRLECAERVAEVGGISCAFNSTVYEKTLHMVPDIMQWAQRHADKVHAVVFIAFRQAVKNFDYFVGDKKVDTTPLTYSKSAPQRFDITANEIVAEIQKRVPEFQPSAYLNGTESPTSFKWLATLAVTDRKRTLGCAGPRLMELSQTLNHLVNGRYLGYADIRTNRQAKALLALSPIEPGLRGVLKSYAKSVAKNPLSLFMPLYLQSVMIIQPVDVLSDGRQSMCDSCPDMTVFNGELVWSCRLDERQKFGQLMRVVPRTEAVKSNGEKV